MILTFNMIKITNLLSIQTINKLLYYLTDKLLIYYTY